MDTNEEREMVSDLIEQVDSNTAAILEALDNVHVLIAQGAKLEKDLQEALQNVSADPGVIRLPLYELDNRLQAIYNNAFMSLDDASRASLANRGVVPQDWRAEFLGTKEITR